MNQLRSWLGGVLLAAAIAIAVGAFAPGASAGGPAEVSPDPLNVRADYADGPFTIDLELTGLEHHGEVLYPEGPVPSVGMAAFEVRLSFDPAIIDVIDITASDFISSSGRNAQCFQQSREPGLHAVACVSVGKRPGVQGSGTLATVTLRPISNGIAELGLEASLSGPLGDPIATTSIGGVIEVVGAPIDVPTPTPGQPGDPDEPGDPDQPGGTDQPGGAGNSGPTVIGPGNLGDITLPAGDASQLFDTNGDTVIDSKDFPVAGTGYEPPGSSGTWIALAGALAALGAALLLLSLRFAGPQQRL
ncbi:MAG: hypothetical protein IIC89_09315 [Chloroflexi bacterium]|nr:hypothetical protein [Chloroflexota bacterium]